MNAETKWIVGTGLGIVVAVVTTGVALAALMVSLIAGVNSRLERIETDVRGLDTRLRAVEVAFARSTSASPRWNGCTCPPPDAGE